MTNNKRTTGTTTNFLHWWQTKLSFWIAAFVFLYWCLSELSR